MNKAMTKNVTIDETTGKPIFNQRFSQDVLDVLHANPDAPNAADTTRTYLNYIEQKQREAERPETIVTNQKVYDDLINRMDDPNNPTTEVEILRAAANPDHSQRISDKDTKHANDLRKALTEQPIKSPAFKNVVADAKAQLGSGDLGMHRFHQFFEELVPIVQRLEREGKLTPGDLSTRDPNSLYNKVLKQYLLNPNEKMTDTFMKHFGIGASPEDAKNFLQQPTFPPPPTNAPPPTTAPSAERRVGNTVVPTELRGIAALQYNTKTGQWRDQTSGIVYDSAGREIKK
jgi:hypothetical protein